MICKQCGFDNIAGAERCIGCNNALPESPKQPIAERAVHTASTVLVKKEAVDDLLAKQAPELAQRLRERAPADRRSTDTSQGRQRPTAAGDAPRRVPPPSTRMPPQAFSTLGPRSMKGKGPSVKDTRAFAGPVVGETFSLVLQDVSGNVLSVLRLDTGRTYLGREDGNLVFPDDPCMAPLHARIDWADDGSLFVKDLGTENGVFLRCRDESPLRDGDRFLVGSQLFSFRGAWPDESGGDGTKRLASTGFEQPHRLVCHGPGDEPVDVRQLEGDLLIGRKAYSPNGKDPLMAREHAEIVFTAEGAVIRDHSGGRGIFLRIREETEIRDGDLLIIGSLSFLLRTGS